MCIIKKQDILPIHFHEFLVMGEKGQAVLCQWRMVICGVFSPIDSRN